MCIYIYIYIYIYRERERDLEREREKTREQFGGECDKIAPLTAPSTYISVH